MRKSTTARRTDRRATRWTSPAATAPMPVWQITSRCGPRRRRSLTPSNMCPSRRLTPDLPKSTARRSHPTPGRPSGGESSPAMGAKRGCDATIEGRVLVEGRPAECPPSSTDGGINGPLANPAQRDRGRAGRYPALPPVDIVGPHLKDPTPAHSVLHLLESAACGHDVAPTRSAPGHVRTQSWSEA